MTTSVSIIICTRDHAESLRATLEALGRVFVPERWTVEVLVVDNGSTDPTPAVVREARLSTMTVRYVLESRPGQSRARNAGLAVARGDIILFTDDDVRPARDWLRSAIASVVSWAPTPPSRWPRSAGRRGSTISWPPWTAN